MGRVEHHETRCGTDVVVGVFVGEAMPSHHRGLMIAGAGGNGGHRKVGRLQSARRIGNFATIRHPASMMIGSKIRHQHWGEALSRWWFQLGTELAQRGIIFSAPSNQSSLKPTSGRQFFLAIFIAVLASNPQKYEHWNHSSYHSHPRACWCLTHVGAQ